MTRVLAPAPAHAPQPARVSKPHDRDEREAERAADEVARGASVAGWSFASQPTGPPTINRCGGPGRCDCPRCRAQAQQLESQGAVLDPAARTFMENAFGHDFGSVRLHGDSRSAASARALDARAYTVGEEIVSAEGTPDVASGPGRQLLAHELAHVVQHRASGDNATVHRQAAGTGTTTPTGPAPASPAKPPPRPDREEHTNLGRGGSRVDAELYRPAGWLTARMKVLFNFSNDLQPWPSPARQTTWQNDFISTVQKRWSFKHFLVPERACPGEPQQVAVNVRVIPVTSSPHMTMKIRYTDKEPTSSVSGATATMDVKDVERRGDVPQTPAEHEFGHMLGLPHIHCNTNDQSCYGVTREEKADVMGMGSYVSPHDYEPFAELMPAFTSCTYKVKQASNIPTSRGPDIGAAIGGVLGGVAGVLAGAALGGLLGPVGAIVGGALGLIGGGLGGFFAGRALGTPEIPS